MPQGTSSGQAPYVQYIEANAPAAAQAAEASVRVGEAEVAGTVTAVTYTPAAAISGANTHTRKLELFNRKQDGSGTTLVASIQFNSGTDAAANDEKALTLTSTAADKVLAEHDILELVSTHVGNGIADPGGRVQVTLDRD